MKFRKLFQLLIIVLFFGMLVACSEEEDFDEQNDGSVTISRIEPQRFAYGDTISVYGNNFGESRGGKYISFQGERPDTEHYLLWTDSLIKVVVPVAIEDGKIIINSQLSNASGYKVDKPWLFEFIEFMVTISLGITVVYLYLRINKIWKRKHDPAVAESQSLAGLAVYILNCVLWVSYYALLTNDIKSIIDSSIYIFEGAIFFLIGTGLFVKGKRQLGIWTLIKQALRLERKEVNYLIKRFFKPSNAEAIISILHQLAMIDDEMDPKELELLQGFAKEWGIDYNPEKLNLGRKVGSEANFDRLRESVVDYLDSEPPFEQAAQLKDMINALIQVDDKVTPEEELIFAELNGLLSNFLSKGKEKANFNVLIVPQKEEHDNLISNIIPDSKKVMVSGGTAYKVGTYYSRKYAEMICSKYREVQLFTIVLLPELMESEEAPQAK